MTENTINVLKAKVCHKVKNPCKICFQRVKHKNGLRCEGACKKWVHFKCLQYTPGRIDDIKKGIIKVTCPCPNCFPPQPKEYLVNPPYTCTDQNCPANKLPKCTSSACSMNMEGEGTYAALYSESDEGPSSSQPGSHGSLAPCRVIEGRPYKLCQPRSQGSLQGYQSPVVTSSDDMDVNNNYPETLLNKRSPSPELNQKRSRSLKNTFQELCFPKQQKNREENSRPHYIEPENAPTQSLSSQKLPPSRKASPRKPKKKSPPHSIEQLPSICSAKKCKLSTSSIATHSSVIQDAEAHSSPIPDSGGSNKSTVKVVKLRAPGLKAAPKQSRSYSGPIAKKQTQPTQQLIDKKGCPISSSDSVIQVSKGQQSLLSALDEMCKTVGRLAMQIKDIMCKLDDVK